MTLPASPFVSAEWLRQHLADPNLRVLDVRWALPTGADPDAFAEAHIPGAQFVDLDEALAGPPGKSGRHPLPEPAKFSAAMRRAGVGARSRVVCYDAGTGAAARAWWLLRAAVHPSARVLDGGIQAWRSSGGEVESGPGSRLPTGDFETGSFRGWVSADELAQRISAGALALDARTHDRFRGEPFPFDPRPGHVPGARNLPWPDLYQDGLVLSPDRIRGRLREFGGRSPDLAYCGSGVTASALILALESAGLDPILLYPGSWSEWAQDPEREAELGD